MTTNTQDALRMALEKIADSWAGCQYDAVGETIDIGKCLRGQFAALSSAKDAAPAIGQFSAIHYPACWDTAAYPTLESALSAVYEHFKCSECAPADHVADAGKTMEEPLIDGYPLWSGLPPKAQVAQQDGALKGDAWLYKFPGEGAIGPWRYSNSAAFIMDRIEKYEIIVKPIWFSCGPSPQSAADALDAEISRLKDQVRKLDSAGFELTARLCAIATVHHKGGYDLIRRDSAMDFVVKWRSMRDAAMQAEKGQKS